MIIVGRVNANKVGEHEPETLLAVKTNVLLKRPHGWNVIWMPRKRCWFRIYDEFGQTIYPVVRMCESDLAEVRIEEAERFVYPTGCEPPDEPQVIQCQRTP